MILKNHIIVSILAMENRMPNLSHTVSTIQWISSFCPDNNKSGFEKCVKIYINEPKINLLAFVLYNTKKKKKIEDTGSSCQQVHEQTFIFVLLSMKSIVIKTHFKWIYLICWIGRWIKLFFHSLFAFSSDKIASNYLHNSPQFSKCFST